MGRIIVQPGTGGGGGGDATAANQIVQINQDATLAEQQTQSATLQGIQNNTNDVATATNQVTSETKLDNIITNTNDVATATNQLTQLAQDATEVTLSATLAEQTTANATLAALDNKRLLRNVASCFVIGGTNPADLQNNVNGVLTANFGSNIISCSGFYDSSIGAGAPYQAIVIINQP